MSNIQQRLARLDQEQGIGEYERFMTNARKFGSQFVKYDDDKKPNNRTAKSKLSSDNYNYRNLNKFNKLKEYKR